jgi:hypothetical protein
MARVPVFYSFHFDNDVMRVQQIRQMGLIDGDEPVSKNDWETVKRGGAGAIERWIDEQHEVQALRRRADRHRYARTAVGDSMRSERLGQTNAACWASHIHNLRSARTAERALRAPTRSTNSPSTTVATTASSCRLSTTRPRTTPTTTSRTT